MAESGVGLGDVIRDGLAAQEFWFELAESRGQKSEVGGSEVRGQVGRVCLESALVRPARWHQIQVFSHREAGAQVRFLNGLGNTLRLMSDL